MMKLKNQSTLNKMFLESTFQINKKSIYVFINIEMFMLFKNLNGILFFQKKDAFSNIHTSLNTF